MNWLQVKIYTNADGIEAVSNCLYSVGVSGLEIEDEKDFKDFLENNTKYWDYVDEDLLAQKKAETCVKVYISDDESGKKELSEIKEKIEALKAENIYGRLAIEITTVNEADWENEWKQYYKPIQIGKRLVICPLWEEVSQADEKVVVKMDPGMAFGTGTHESTRLCLEACEKYVKTNQKVLDLGCGSGILSISALKLGAKSAVAIDIDELAVKITKENAGYNNIFDELTAIEGNILEDRSLASHETYDIIFANIVADVIIALSPIMHSQLKQGGILITSGIIDIRKDEVISALIANGFEIKEINEDRGWVCLVCCRG